VHGRVRLRFLRTWLIHRHSDNVRAIGAVHSVCLLLVILHRYPQEIASQTSLTYKTQKQGNSDSKSLEILSPVHR
jgi:hypothetical protein